MRGDRNRLAVLTTCGLVLVLSGAIAAEDGLVGYWAFDEDTGTMAQDSSPLGNHGTVHGATWVAGKVGGALSFSGSDSDYVEIPNESDYDLQNAVSYAVWIKADPSSSISWMGIITKGDNMTKGVSTNKGRVMGLSRTPSYVAGNRFGFDGEVAIPKVDGWNHFANAIYQTSGINFFNA